MSTEFILPTLTLFFSIVLLLTTQRKYVGSPTRIIGGLLFVTGLLISFFGFDHTYVFSPNQNLNAPERDNQTAGSIAWNAQYTILPTSASLPSPERIDLSQRGLPIDSILERKSPTWIILDASKGIHSDYRKYIEDYFGLLIDFKDQTVKNLCWHRNSLFPLSSGECHDRVASFVFKSSEDDLTRNSEGLSTVRLKLINKAVKILLTHALPAQNVSREEGCLLGLAKQSLCIAIDNLPGTTLSALSLYSKDKVTLKVFEEFGISNDVTLEKGIARYQPNNEAMQVEIEQTADPKGCLGITASKQIQIAKLNWYNSIWSNVSSYKNLLKSSDIFDSHLGCAGLAKIELEASKMKKPEAAVRTLLTTLQEKLFWLTTPASFSNRLHKLEGIKIAADIQQAQAVLTTEEPIYDLSLTVIAPVSVEEEQGLELSTSSKLNNWSLFQTGENSFKITIPELKSMAIFNLKDFLNSLSAPKLTWSTYWRTAGTKESVSIAFIFATLLSMAQVASPSRRTRMGWQYSYFAIFILIYVIVFSSYHFSRREGGSKPFLSSFEDTQGAPHFFLRDWPLDWFNRIPDTPMPLSLSKVDLNTKWKEILQGSQQRAKVLSEQTLKPKLVQNFIPLVPLVKSGQPVKKVLIWDNPIARNFYFRKTLTYQLSMQAWMTLASRSDKRWTVHNERNLPTHLKPDSLLIVPDLSFTSESDLEILEKFVSEGGTLVFSDHISPEANNITWSPKPNPFVAQLSALGAGKTTTSYFTPINENGLSAMITAPHVKAEGHWVRGQSYQKGHTVFFGVQPIESKSQLVVSEIIDRLSGQEYKIPDIGNNCATSILVKPFAQTSTLEDLVKKAKDAEIDLKWFVDPISFAAMVPAWKDHFLKEGVVFIDDGTEYNRYLAEDLWKEFLAQNNRPDATLLLASESGEIYNKATGPKSQLVPGVLIASSKDKSLANWNLECRQGLARPRILPHNLRTSEFNAIFQKIKDDKKQAWLNYTELSKRISILNQTEFKQFKTVTFQKASPLELEP